MKPRPKPPVPAGPVPADPGRARNRRELFLTSFLVLFFELACLRFIPSTVRVLSFFMNFVLLAAFLGIGCGILSARRTFRRIPFVAAFPVLLLVLLLATWANQYSFVLTSTQVLYYGAQEIAAQGGDHFYSLPILFILVTLSFMVLARPLGRLLTALPALEAYAVDILGSLTGIAAFFVISYLSLPPVVWFGIVAAVFLILTPRREIPVAAVCLGLSLYVVVTLCAGSEWSPYYKITRTPSSRGGWLINVNGVGHQEIVPNLNMKEPFYFRAYASLTARGKQPFRRVLVIGSGSGSDVAIALSYGAEHVDAVEIDPAIYQLGLELNPAQPYADPRVTVYIDDGRAFLEHSEDRYDLIVFALTDSLTLTSGYSSLRLESFLYTTGAMTSARRHLSGEGLLVLYNYYRYDWLVHKLAGMLDASFGAPPFVTTYGAWGRAAVLMEGPRLGLLDPSLDVPYGEGRPAPVTFQGGNQLPMLGWGRMKGDGVSVPASDDWPFVYMPRPAMPTIFLGALAMVAAIALVAVASVAPRSVLLRLDWHFFLLGAAFMALETRSLVTFALLFGTTWMVNSLVFFAILASVFAAIVFKARFKIPRPGILYAALFASLLLNYVLPEALLLGINPPWLRYTLASLLAFAPIALANVVFARSFQSTVAADVAFASNLIGAVAGGMLEYTALATGYRALTLIVVALYAAAVWRKAPSGKAAIPVLQA